MPVKMLAARSSTSGRASILAITLLLSPSIAFGQTLELSGVYGNEAGCKVASGAEKPGEEALVVRSDRFESASLTCEFVQVLKAADGTSVITALCDIDGEDGRSVNLFTVTASKSDPAALQIRDEYGAPWDEVKPCG